MTNYFSLLDISESFDIDLAALEKAYFAAQRRYHPDRFANKSAEERARSMQISVDINNAYHTLKDPLKRAQYLLKEQAVVVGTEADTIKPSHDLLLEVMEWRENETDMATLRTIREESIALIQNHYTNNAWEPMAQETLRLGYIVKILEDHK